MKTFFKVCDHTCAALNSGFHDGRKERNCNWVVTLIDLFNTKLLVHEVYINLCFTSGNLLVMEFNTVVFSSI